MKINLFAENQGGGHAAPKSGSTASSGKGPEFLPAFKLRRILVPVDFTECSKEAMLYALPFARQFNAELTLLHVVGMSYLPPSEMGGITDVDTMDVADERLRQMRADIPADVRCQTHLCRGVAGPEILTTAKELAIDLIILSTHGRKGLERMLLGSTAEQIVRHAACPILVVRPNEHEFVDAGQNEQTEPFQEGHRPEFQMETEMILGR